jgi:DNA-binding transcriptional ArsR family regulator
MGHNALGDGGVLGGSLRRSQRDQLAIEWLWRGHDDRRCLPAPRQRVSKSRLACKSRLAYYLGVADVYSAIADPTRRAILDELTDRDGQTLFEICSRLVMKHGLSSTRQAISQHLDVLEAASLVTTQWEGRYKLHYINTRPLRSNFAR